MPRSGSSRARRRSASTSASSSGRELVDLRAREQGRVDLEVGVLGRRADQGHQPLLDGGQERVLLGLVEAVDLVEEEDRRPAGLAALGRAREHLAHLGPPRVDGRELLERAVGAAGDDPRERRLAGPGRAVEDGAVGLAGLDRDAQRRAGGEQLALAGELVDGARAHPRRERRAVGGSGEPRRPSPPVSKRLSAITDKYETLRPMEEGTAQAAPAGLEASAVELLRALIREDTVNPPGNERALQERLAADADRGRVRVRAARRRARAPEPARQAARRRRPDARLPRPRRHRPRRPRGVEPRPLVRRPRGRLGLGPRRARHEGPGRLRACGRARPRPLGLGARRASCCWSSPPTRRPAATSAHAGSARTTPTRSAATSPSTRAAGPRSRWTAAASTRSASARRGSSGSSCGSRASRATPRCRRSATTRC